MRSPAEPPPARTSPCHHPAPPGDAESRRLDEDARRQKNWKRWGPYLSERQWATVREDYSPDGSPWTYFPFEHAHQRAYRWGEDGLLGVTDRECRLCFALALWNGKDPILKERLFGLTGPQGNHGEDVKESYFYLDATPTYSFFRALYRYPQEAFPYTALIQENARRSRKDPEYELADTGTFSQDRYFDVLAEYAKSSPNDLLIRICVANRGQGPATLHLLPTLWFRNTWSWGCRHEGCWVKPHIRQAADGLLEAYHATLGRFHLAAEPPAPRFLFTENETNVARLFHAASPSPYTKDAFHDYLIHGREDAVNPSGQGTKAAAVYPLRLPPGGEASVRLRLFSDDEVPDRPFGDSHDHIFALRQREADAFYERRLATSLRPEERLVARQAFASTLWSKQFYHYVIRDWLDGDPEQPPPPPQRRSGRNHDWPHLFNRDVISVPDKWEYPWYAAWDLAFHMIPFARIDPQFAKDQLVLFLREWYMHPNGQIPAYEFDLSNVNPPVHAWACWRVYKMTGASGNRDRLFLTRVFNKLLINFTWWVNRKDGDDNHIFSGGFLGLDNIGVFDRSAPLPHGGRLEQADATAWMAFYCLNMLAMAIELAVHDPAYEDVASKFFEHFVAIADAMNTFNGTGLWDEADGFYYDQMHVHTTGTTTPLRVRSMVGLIPLIAVEVLHCDVIERLSGFSRRLRWFLENRPDLARHIAYLEEYDFGPDAHRQRLLAIPSRDRLRRVLSRLLDENEFLSPYGIRSLSRDHAEHPYVLTFGSQEYRVEYSPAESPTPLFGGNSNWRGPVWFPLNYLIIEALERYHHFYGDSLRVEYPTGAGNALTLGQIAHHLAARLAALFLPDETGRRPYQGAGSPSAQVPHGSDPILFHEYFNGDTGQGLGASHQTGWTALVVDWLQDVARARAGT